MEKEPGKEATILANLTPGINRFFSLPAEIRERLISDCLKRAEEDNRFFAVTRRSIDNFPEGYILPSGNTVIVDSFGRNIVRAPIPDYLPVDPKNN